MSESTGGAREAGAEDGPVAQRSAEERQTAAEARDADAGTRDEIAEHRDEAAEGRDRTWPTASGSDSADAAAGRRDDVAEARDRRADQRDVGAEERDRRAEERDRSLGDSRVGAREPLTLDLAAEIESFRLAATSDRRDSALDRHDAADDRAGSSDERAESARDREAASGGRSEAGQDRAASAGDRGASGGDRRAAGVDRWRSADDRRAARVERRAATRDGLTGAHLRGPGLVELEREIARAARTGEPLSVAFVDVDGLKAVNDSGGHAAGDRLLLEVVTTLRRHLRPYDLVIRVGGDEFVCALPGLGAVEAGERMASVNTALAHGPEDGSVTAGIAALAPGDTVETLVGRADAALYRQKGSGCPGSEIG